MERTKANSASTPKYLLSKKEISVEEFHTMLSQNEQFTQASNGDKAIRLSNGNSNKSKAQQRLVDTASKQLSEKKEKGTQQEQLQRLRAMAPTSTKEKQQMEVQMNQKWQDNCDALLYECKAQERNPKEKLLEEKMKERLEQQVRRDLYKSEYDGVVDKIRREVQQDIAKEFVQKKQREIEHIKKKIEYSTQVKLAEYEKQLTLQLKESFDKEKKEMLDEKEAEIREVFRDKLVQIKEKARSDLTEKYTALNNDLMREIDDMKSQYAIQREKERKRLAKLNEMQFSCLQEEIIHKEKSKEINALLTACKSKDAKQNEWTQPKAMIRKSNSKSNIPTRNMNINTSGIASFNQSVNLFEVNNRIKNTSPRNETTIPIKPNNKAHEYNHFLLKK